MFSYIARWSAFSSLLFLGAIASPPALQAQQAGPAEGVPISTQAATIAPIPFPTSILIQPGVAASSSMVAKAGPARVIDSRLSLSDPLLLPFGISMPVQASPPLPLNIVRQQDDGVHVGANLALMGVGAAGLVTGLIMDNDAGTIIAVGGGVVFLIGFYRWLR